MERPRETQPRHISSRSQGTRVLGGSSGAGGGARGERGGLAVAVEKTNGGDRLCRGLDDSFALALGSFYGSATAILSLLPFSSCLGIFKKIDLLLE